MNKHNFPIYIPGSTGLVGQAFVRKLKDDGSVSLLLNTHLELDLTNQEALADFISAEKPDCVILAGAKVDGFMPTQLTPPNSFMKTL